MSMSFHLKRAIRDLFRLVNIDIHRIPEYEKTNSNG